MNPYDIVTEFEHRVADYAGAKYGVAVNSCTNALLLSFVYRFRYCGDGPWVEMPNRTYVGVPMAILAAGGTCAFRDQQWQGAYDFIGRDDAGRVLLDITDSARRFRRGMFNDVSWKNLYCVSFHWHKHLPIGRGGMILTNDAVAASTLQRMRYDGRTAGVAPADDIFDVPGYHCYMIPEDAARGLMLMANMPDDNPDLPWDNYPDLSKIPMFGQVTA